MQAKDMAVNFPKVKAILWFDEVKAEPTAGGAVIDWRYSANQQILSGLSSFIQLPAKSTGRKYWLQLPDFTSSGTSTLSFRSIWCFHCLSAPFGVPIEIHTFAFCKTYIQCSRPDQASDPFPSPHRFPRGLTRTSDIFDWSLGDSMSPVERWCDL